MKVVEKKNAKGTSFEMQFDPENKLILIKRHDEAPSFAIGFLIDGTWHYQSLMWSGRESVLVSPFDRVLPAHPEEPDHRLQFAFSGLWRSAPEAHRRLRNRYRKAPGVESCR